MDRKRACHDHVHGLTDCGRPIGAISAQPPPQPPILAARRCQLRMANNSSTFIIMQMSLFTNKNSTILRQPWFRRQCTGLTQQIQLTCSSFSFSLFTEREYRCLGNWEEDGVLYTFTQRRDMPGYQCFVSITQTIPLLSSAIYQQPPQPVIVHCHQAASPASSALLWSTTIYLSFFCFPSHFPITLHHLTLTFLFRFLLLKNLGR